MLAEPIVRGTGGTDSAEYCYTIWLRHLILSNRNGSEEFPKVVAELGPGDSIGVGLAALVSGADKYVALDVVRHQRLHAISVIFERIVELFRARHPLWGIEHFPGMEISVPCHFPIELIGESRLKEAMDERRLDRIRDELRSGKGHSFVEYKAPWTSISDIDESSVDLLISNAVMEHVADIDLANGAIARWLKPGGIASHQIDFRSHGLFSTWDGHWRCPHWLWKMLLGKRPYLLNRLSLTDHLHSARISGMEIVAVMRQSRQRTSAAKVAREFAGMNELDRETSGAYVLTRRQ